MPQDTDNTQIVRVLLGASLVLGSVYPLFEPQLALVPGVVLKGLCVGLLALVALLWARGTDGWLLAGVMAAGTAGDVLLGLAAQATIGAALEEGYGDPLLNSQIRYLGAVWLGFGALLWHGLGDLPKHSAILRGALTIVFVGGLGRVAAVLQLGPKGIRVNALSPGAMKTLSLAGISGGRGMLAKGRSLSAMKEDTAMEGVTGAALWLLSDLGLSTTGEVVHVDAGFHIMGFSDDEAES